MLARCGRGRLLMRSAVGSLLRPFRNSTPNKIIRRPSLLYIPKKRCLIAAGFGPGGAACAALPSFGDRLYRADTFTSAFCPGAGNSRSPAKGRRCCGASTCPGAASGTRASTPQPASPRATFPVQLDGQPDRRLRRRQCGRRRVQRQGPAEPVRRLQPDVWAEHDREQHADANAVHARARSQRQHAGQIHPRRRHFF